MANDDVGPEVVEFVLRIMQIDERWSVRSERGFTWWGKDLAQTVWADPPFEDRGFTITRMHARTDFFRDTEPSEGNIAFFKTLNADAAMSSLVFDTGETGNVHLATSAYLHRENLTTMQGVFAFAVAMQVADAQWSAPGLSDMFRFSLASSGHPTSGARHEPDDMLNMIDTLIKPRGKEPSMWAGKDLTTTLEMLQGPPCVFASGSERGLAAEFPCKGRTSLLRVATDRPHRLFGNGVYIELNVPNCFLPRYRHDVEWLAPDLNRRELRSFTHAHFFGSWHAGAPEHGTLSHISFFPNALYAPGLLPNLVMSAAQRAKWIAEEIFGDDWAWTYSKTRPAFTQIIGPAVDSSASGNPGLSSWKSTEPVPKPKKIVEISGAGEMCWQSSKNNREIVVFRSGTSGAPTLIELATGESDAAWDVEGFAWHPNGRYLAVALSGEHSKGQLQILDTNDRKVISWIESEDAATTGLVWSPSGTYLATTAIDRGVRLLKFSNNNLRHIASAPLKEPSEFLGECRAPVFSADEHTLIVVGAKSWLGDGSVMFQIAWDRCRRLFVLDVPSLRVARIIGPPQGQILVDLNYQHNCRPVAMTLEADLKLKTFLMDISDGSMTSLPFSAWRSYWHPLNDHVCVFTTEESVLVADLEARKIVAKLPIDKDESEFVEVCWGTNGNVLNVMTRNDSTGEAQLYSYDFRHGD